MPGRSVHRFVRFLLSALLATGVAAQPADYLDPDLRARVETLKAEVAERPTDADTVRQRTDVLWDWLNAYSMTGGYLPVDVTTVVRRTAPASPAGLARIDAFIGELTFLDERPDAPRPAQRRHRALRGPFPSGVHADLGSRHAGSRSRRRHRGDPALHGELRRLPDRRPGRRRPREHCELQRLRAVRRGHGARLRHARRLPRGRPGALLPPRRRPPRTRRHRDGHLRRPIRGRTRTADAEFLQRPHALPPLRRLRGGAGTSSPLPIQPIRVTGTDLAGVHGFAPSVVRPGAPFDLAVRAEDRFYNRAKGPYPEWRVYANGAHIGDLAAGDEPIVVLGDVRFEEPGRLPDHHRLGRRQHHRCREPRARLPGRLPRLLGRHPRPLGLRRRDRHPGPLHDLGQGGRPTRFRDPLGTRHLDRRFRVGGDEAPRRHLLRGRTLHRLSRLRVDYPEPVRRTPQRPLPHAGGPPARPDPVLPDTVGPVRGAARNARSGGRGGDPPRAPVRQLPPERSEAAAARRDHVPARRLRVVRPGVPAPWAPGRLHRGERQPPRPARLHGAARRRAGTAGRPRRGTRGGVVPRRAVRLPEGGPGLRDHGGPHHPAGDGERRGDGAAHAVRHGATYRRAGHRHGPHRHDHRRQERRGSLAHGLRHRQPGRPPAAGGDLPSHVRLALRAHAPGRQSPRLAPLARDARSDRRATRRR